MRDQGPVHQVFRMQDRQPRNRIETGRNHVKIVAHPDCVWIGVIGIEDGILVGAVSVVGNPDFGGRARRRARCLRGRHRRVPQQR